MSATNRHPPKQRAWPLSSRLAHRACGFALLGMVSGCAVGPNFHRPDPPPVSHYANGTDPAVTAAVDGIAQRFSPGAEVAADWWRLFGSSALDAVIAEAVASNPGLDAAQASLRASQNSLRSGYGIFYPAIDAGSAATRERFSAANFGESTAGSVFNLFTLSASVSYALDVFGGQRRMVEGLRAESGRRAGDRAGHLPDTDRESGQYGHCQGSLSGGDRGNGAAHRIAGPASTAGRRFRHGVVPYPIRTC